MIEATPNCRSAKGETPLFLAAREGRLEVVKYLTRKGANKTIPDVLGRSPAWIAASRGQVSVLRHLLRNRAPIEQGGL